MPRGRPKADIDPKKVFELAKIGCTGEEIATVLGYSRKTILMRFRAELDRGRDDMRMSLRRWQYTKAREGSVPMLIWLGKQYLDQRDKADTTVREEVVTIQEIAAKIPQADE